LPSYRFPDSVTDFHRSHRYFASNCRRLCRFVLIGLCLHLPIAANSQESGVSPEAKAPVESSALEKPQVESELIAEGLVSYGNYKIFASGTGSKLYTGGLEYDRHSWGYFLGARIDYVAEILPLVLLDTPTKSYPWGYPETTAHHIVPGLGISPIGFRMMWRPRKAIRPYLTAKGGMIGFTEKVLATNATYESFSLQSGFGVQVMVKKRVGLRLGLWGDYHFSNAFMVPVNPGIDMMNANLGLSYHFGG
jgi:Lipid A 3-O-deacylase (PagL)